MQLKQCAVVDHLMDANLSRKQEIHSVLTMHIFAHILFAHYWHLVLQEEWHLNIYTILT